MAQIPIFGGSQQIQASSPVAIGSGENARMQGEATAGFGETMFKLGNALDAVGRRAKDQADKYEVARAINMGRLAMLEKKAIQDARGITPEDRPDGFTGVERFKSDVDPILDQIAEKLGDPAKRAAFYSGISDDFVTESTKVLAGEVVKREKTVPILRQDNIMGKGAAIRKDPRLLEDMMKEVEIDILNDSMMAEDQKPAAILGAKKQLAKETLNGYMDRAERGDTMAWQNARNNLTQKFGQIFTSEELDKEMTSINTAENSWYTRQHQAITRKNYLDDRAAEDRKDVAAKKYTAMLSEAGNSDNKRGPILSMIEQDPAFDKFPDEKKRFLENRTFTDLGDDKYELDVISKALKSRDYGKLIDKVKADAGDKLTNDRATRLLKSLEGMKESMRTDPTLLKFIDQGRDEIEAYSKKGTFDVVTGMMRQENDTANELMQTQYMQRIAVLSEKGNLSPGTVRAAIDSVLSTNGGRTIEQNVPGVAPHKMSSTVEIKKTYDELYRKFKDPKTTQQEKNAIKDQLKGIKKNEAAVENRERFRMTPQMGGGNNKVFDE